MTTAYLPAAIVSPAKELMEKTQLKTAPFGQTGMEIIRVGFGALAVGGGKGGQPEGPYRTTLRSLHGDSLSRELERSEGGN